MKPNGRHSSRHRNLRSIILLLLCASLFSCGGDSPTDPQDGGGGQPTALTIGLTTSSARPGAAVPIDGIAPNVDVDGLYLTVTEVSTVARASASSEHQTIALIARHDDGVPYFIAPLNPRGVASGGTVELQLAGNNLTSNPISFTIEPLPAATVTVKNLIDNLQGLMDTWLDVHGVTRQELRNADPQSMPAWMYPLWHAHEILDNPDNPNSLRATVDGPVPFFNNEIVDFDVVDRMLSTTGIVDFLAGELASVDSLPRADTLTVPPPSPTQRRVLAQVARDCNVPAGDYGISTASQLDIYMEQAVAAQERLDGHETLTNLGYAVSAAGTIPVLKPGATVISGGMYVYKLMNDAGGRLLPTTFDYQATNFDVGENDFEYYEDDEGGYWTNLRVTALSAGWKLDEAALKAVLKLAKILIGIPDGENLTEFENNVTNFILTQATKLFIGGVTDGSSFLEVCPGTWHISEGMSSSLFSKSDIIGTSFEITNHTFFETRGPGVSELEVGTRPGRFGNVFPTKRTKTVEVIAIEVEVTPSPVTLEDDEKMSFDAVVKNARDKDVDWDVPAPLVELSRSNFGRTIEVQAPDENTEWDQVQLKARSQAKTGSREGKVNSDPRDGFAVINHKDTVSVMIQPSYACVRTGKDTTFTANVRGAAPGTYTIEWKVESGWGTIDQNGNYTAPEAGVTDDIISATVVEHPNAKATADVHVGACNCEFVITTSGFSLWGTEVAYTFSDLPEGFHNYQFYYELQEAGAPPGVTFSLNIGPTDEGTAPRPGQTGRYRVQVAYFDGVTTWTTNDSSAVAYVTISEHTDTYMKGQFAGRVARADDPDFTTGVSGNFRAGRWGGGQGWPCGD